MNLRDLLYTARKHNASDVHLLAGMPPMFRIHGEIVATRGETLDADRLQAMLDECLTDEQASRLERDWELCVSLVYPNIGRARLTVYRRNGRNEMAIRMSELQMRTREQLGLPTIVDDLARKPNGLVMLTGPTGVGKTTTLHYMLDLINAERSCKIVTLEDPIEYVHPFKRAIIVQQELLVDVTEFAGALRHVLRQDPDVIAVGEMRDPETIYTALMAAETGHLVIATLHTPGAAEVVNRLVCAFPEGRQDEIRNLLASTLQGIIAQQLLPRAGDRGRCMCAEVMVATGAVRNHIRSNTQHQLISEMQSGRKHGMITTDQLLLDLYQSGEITYETAVSHARHPENVRKRGDKIAV